MEKYICGFLFVAIVIVYAWSLEFREEIQNMVRKFIHPWRESQNRLEHDKWLENLSNQEREEFDQALDDPLGKKED